MFLFKKKILFLSLFTFSFLLTFFLVGQVRSQPVGPWFVTEGGDLHSNAGSVSSDIPATCTEAAGCNLNHYRIKGYGPVLPGVPDTLSMPLRFGLEEAGVISSGGFDTARIRYDYAYFERLFADLPACTADDEVSCIRDENWNGAYALTPNVGGAPGPLRDMGLGPGIFKSNTDVTIDWTNEFDFQDGNGDVDTNWVITSGDIVTLLVDGDVLIENGIRFQQTTTGSGGMLAIIASGSIAFHSDIVSGEESGGVWSDTSQRVGGVYVADNRIITCANGYDSPAPSGDCDGQVLFGGVFVAWGGFDLGRDLGSTLNATAPSEVFVYIPEFTACLPACFKRPIHFWQERLPGPTP